MRGGLPAVVAVLALGCAATHPNQPTTLTIRPPAPGAPSYEVASSAGAIWADDALVPVLSRAIEQGANVGGERLTGDGRLATLASWLGAHMQRDGGLPPAEITDYYARHLGLTDVMPRVLVVTAPAPEALARQLSQAVALAMAEQPATHFGLASSTAKGDGSGEGGSGRARWLLVLSYRPVSLGRIPRALPAGAPIHLRGSVPSGFGNPQVEVVGPGRTREVVPAGSGPGFDVRIPTEHAGVYEVEVVASGRRGNRALARMPIYVGTAAPRERTFPPRDDFLRARQARQRLIDALQAERRRSGLPELTLDPVLSTVAARHSVDMRDGAFVAHESPRTGGPQERVERAGYGRALVLESVARAQSPERLLGALIDNPRKRQNLENPDVNHMGVAVVAQPWTGGTRFLATLLLVPVQPTIDLAAAPSELLELVNQARAEHGHGPVELDPDLNTAAQQSATDFFEPPLQDEQGAVQQVNTALADLRLHFRRTGAVVALVPKLADAAALEAVLDPSLSHVGIGVAQGDRPDRMPNGIAAVITLGWQR